MRFRLVYDGELKASGSGKTRGAEKWVLRNKFQPQLASLFMTHPVVQGIGLTTRTDPRRAVRPAVVDVDVTTGHQKKNREAILLPIKIGDHCFIPLVRKSLALVCELDILFLRNDAPGSLVKSGGDLDNRIKTLFDGLRMPTLDELKVGAPDADPCYCLLENDDLISGFSVRTDRLLTDPNRSESRVLLVIEVKLTALRLTTQNVGFLTD